MFINNFLLCIVLYKTSIEQSKTYSSFVQKYSECNLFIYDNSPTANVINRPNTIYIHDPKNSGLSVAYNKAAEYAKENGYKWLLLMDQDTDFSGISITDYEKAISNNPTIKVFAPKIKCGAKYMSPVKIWHHIGFLQNKVPSGIISLSRYGIINSGMCVNVDAMIECGGYNEKVFLDHSDFEFLEKLKRLYSSAYIIDAEIKQNLSTFSDNKSTTLRRYTLYCKSIKGCEHRGLFDSCGLFVLVLKRGISICVREKTLKSLTIFFKEYLCAHQN